ncbi:STY0301 family protein [Azospirillum sp. HJ39]|uniref:STY0301 family protein n=1 Tax=Azospirillum sp. HJ39 TaxID=3159496 RepID=UPI003555C4AB
MRPILVTAALLLAAAATPVSAAGLDCPASLTVQAQPDAPGGWSPYPGRDSHGFAGVSIVEGDRAAQMASAAPATLAPDREVRRGRSLLQVWEFAGPRRETVFVVCRYRDTQATLAADLPRSIRRCTLTLETDIRGAVLEEPKTPPRLDCR